MNVVSSLLTGYLLLPGYSLERQWTDPNKIRPREGNQKPNQPEDKVITRRKTTTRQKTITVKTQPEENFASVSAPSPFKIPDFAFDSKTSVLGKTCVSSVLKSKIPG